MLLEEGVIVRGEEHWLVELPRLKKLHVPPTLTGVLQARLDSLPREAKEVLQRASVVGRVFWNGAVAALAADGEAPPEATAVAPLLDAVRERELVFRRERSSFAGSEEYIFKNLILHDVTYQTMLLRLRRAYHKRVALWLEANAGERVSEYAGLIAEHYERAGERTLAAQSLRRVAEAASQSGAFREAIAAAERALALLPEDDKDTRADLLRLAGLSYSYLGDYALARDKLNAGLALARETGDGKAAARALCELARLAYHQGVFAEIHAPASEALTLARVAGDQEAEALALNYLGAAARDPALKARFYEDALALRRKIGDKTGIAGSLNNLGEVARSQGDYARAKHYYEESLAIAREIGNRAYMSMYLCNLGEVAAAQKDPVAATRCHQEALAICHDIGFRLNAAHCLGGLGYTAAATGDLDGAQRYFQQALSLAIEIGSLLATLYLLVGFAKVKAQAGDSMRATEWLGLVLRYPAATAATDVEQRAQSLLADLRAALPAEQLEAALARGKGLDLQTVIDGILAAP